MRNREIEKYERRLNRLFGKFNTITDDPELLAHWSRYLCILVSGYLEEAIRAVLRDYSRLKAAPNIANHVDTNLRSFRNPKMEPILKLSGSFSEAWRKNIEMSCKDEIKDAVDSIVNIRNQIAHGKDVGITPGILRKYYENAQKLVVLLETQCNC